MDISHLFPKGTRGIKHRGYLPPKGALLAAFEQAMEAGCIQAEMDSLRGMYAAIMVWTNCNPCCGCPEWDRIGPKCGCFQKHHTAYRDVLKQNKARVEETTSPSSAGLPLQFTGLTTKQIAEKLGVSKNEVRRRKAAGTL